ncbi:MAG: SRPBCC domain-containing protein [Thermoleophilaceae bacterium]
MKLEQSFEVRAPVEEVWNALIDIERVAPCLPGAEITERDEDGTYRGDFKVKLGPTTAAYRGTLKMESLDEAAHVATMLANGQDKRGQGSAKATIVSRMTESAGVTQVEVETDFTITGKLARFGRGGMIKDISNRLLGDFARCLQAGFEGYEASAATDGSAAPEVTEAGSGASAAPAPAANEASGSEAPDVTEVSGPDPSEAEPAAADASAAAGSQVPPTEDRATRGGAEESARSPGERAAAAPSSEGPGGPDAPRVDTGVGAPDSPAAAQMSGVRSPAPSSSGPRTGGGPRFSPPAASQPISGAGLVGSVLLDRAAPVLLPVVRALRQLLERLERALGGSP